MVVGLRITRLSEEVTSAVNEKYMNALKKKFRLLLLASIISLILMCKVVYVFSLSPSILPFLLLQPKMPTGPRLGKEDSTVWEIRNPNKPPGKKKRCGFLLELVT